jgi:hypothetical protein
MLTCPGKTTKARKWLVDPELAKSLRKIALKIDKLALYAFIVLAIAAARLA